MHGRQHLVRRNVRGQPLINSQRPAVGEHRVIASGALSHGI
jgi:hypothetical protein